VTGTEWEFEDAIKSMRARHVPEVLVYRKRNAALQLPDSVTALAERQEQLRLVEAFFQRWFASRPDGNVDVALRKFSSTPEFEKLVEEHLRKLLKQRLGGGTTTVRWHAGSPYRGLQAFEPEHGEIFFGRANASRALRDLLERRLAGHVPFVAVLGASGSGKSSLVKAGLIPNLAAGSWLGGIGFSRHAILRPADDERHPLGALARALLGPSALPELAQRGLDSPQKTEALLRESPASAASMIMQTLRDAAAQAPPRAHQRAGLLIVVDQLEELFTSPFSPDARRSFVNVLEVLAQTSADPTLPDDAPPILVVATMRSDFFGQLDQLPRLAHLIEGDGQFLLLPPDEHEIGQMIRHPAAFAGLRFERDEDRGLGLDYEILAVAKRDTRVLPLLSFVLDQLWQQRSAEGMLTFEAYRRLGGLEGALAMRAEGVLASQPAEVQAALPNVLGALVDVPVAQSTGERNASAIRFTARWIPIDRFAEGSAERRLIAALLNPDVRLLVAEGDRSEARVRVAHEALLTHWLRARELLEADRIDLLLIERLEEAERLWREAPPDKRPDRLLPSGLALFEATDLLSRRRERLAPPIVLFIESSLAADRERLEQRSRRARWLVTGFAGLTLVASVFGMAAWRQSFHARDAAEVAERRAADVLSLSAIQDLQEVVDRADKLWPAHPETVPAYEQWLKEARDLIEGRPADPEHDIKPRPSLAQHKAKLVEIRRRAMPHTDDERRAQRESHPRLAELAAKRAELFWRSQMLGLDPWPSEAEVEECLASEELPSEANGLNNIAWLRVNPDKPVYGEEVKALVLARRAVATALAAERAYCIDTLAWALFKLGRFDEALAEERRAAEEVDSSRRAEFEGYVAKLEKAIETWRGESALSERRKEREALAREVEAIDLELNERGTWTFQHLEDRWWHAQLSKLVADLEALRDPLSGLYSVGMSEKHGWGVRKRYEFAKTIEDRTTKGTDAAERWSEAIEAIASSPQYGGMRITPQIGLLAIGADPVSELWEFVHLQTTELGVDPIPKRADDGRLLITESTGLIFVLIPQASFWMGARKQDQLGHNYDRQADRDESPPHEVTLSAYFLSKYEMTQGQWLRIAGRNPSNFDPSKMFFGHQHDLRHPVEQVSWLDCRALLGQLALELPTEAQWERGCRGGTDTPWWTGPERESLRGRVNLADQAAKRAERDWDDIKDWPDLDDGWVAHAPVGSLPANTFGLHEVHGNVWEWCLDGYDGGFYATSPVLDPVAPWDSASARVIRGGSMFNAASYARSANRINRAPESYYSDLGLRPTRSITP
jgi:formylglycine-generating enzyme required for sulfatase activity